MDINKCIYYKLFNRIDKFWLLLRKIFILYTGTKGSDCLPYVPSALSGTRLNEGENYEDDDPFNLGSSMDEEVANPDLEPSFTKGETAHGLEVIQNISVKDGFVIGFMFSLWMYSLVLMYRYLEKMKHFIYKYIF